MQIWPTARVKRERALACIVALTLGIPFAVMVHPAAALGGVPFGALYYWRAMRKYRARRALVEQPFPESWRQLLRERVSFYGRLHADGRHRFEQNVRVFLAEQRIYGLGREEVQESTRVLIAASAAMLTHGMPEWEWGTVRDIIVYPANFNERYDMEDDPNLSGMVHAQGPVLLSAPSLRMGFRRGSDGHNVALHELAHVMDFADGYADGLPAGLQWHSSAPWVEMVAERLERVRGPGHPALRRYAGKNEAELFAVAVEVFFERPAHLRDHDPELFELLEEFFGLDPEHPSARHAPSEPS